MLGNGGQQAKIVGVAFIPALNRPLVKRFFRMPDDFFGSKILAFAQAITHGTRAIGVVKTKQFWFKLSNRAIADRAAMFGGQNFILKLGIHVMQDSNVATES